MIRLKASVLIDAWNVLFRCISNGTIQQNYSTELSTTLLSVLVNYYYLYINININIT